MSHQVRVPADVPDECGTEYPIVYGKMAACSSTSFPSGLPLRLLSIDVSCRSITGMISGSRPCSDSTIAIETGTIRYLGDVKIGQADLDRDMSRSQVPVEFDRLGDDFFSLGQDASYYQRINELTDQTAEEILRSLNDVAFDLDLFDRALRHRVTGVSLLRNVSWATVRNQFHRVALGGLRLSPFASRTCIRRSGLVPSTDPI